MRPPARGCRRWVLGATEGLLQFRHWHAHLAQLAFAQGQREIPAPHQRAHPRRFFVGIAVRRRILKQAVAHAPQRIHQRPASSHIGVRSEGPQRANHELQRALQELATRDHELLAVQQHAQHALDVAASSRELRCHTVHDALRRCVADEAHAQFFRDELGRARVAAHDVHQRLQVLLLASGGNDMPQHSLLAIVMPVVAEVALACIQSKGAAAVKGPAGQATRGLAHIGLRIAAIHAQRVQLHQLARIVLIRHILRIGAHLVRLAIQIHEHRGRRRAGADEVLEVAQRVLANHIAIIARLQVNAVALLQVDVEVVRPELDHDLEQLPLAVDSAQQRVARDLVT